MSCLTQTPALLLGTGITALGTARSLGSANVPAYLAAAYPDFEASSRWTKLLPVTCPHLEEDSALDVFLASLPFDGAVLFPCSDFWVRSVAALAPEMTSRFRASLSSADVLHSLSDKAELARVLMENNIPHPLSVSVRDEKDVMNLAVQLKGNCFLKPRDSQAYFKRFKRKAVSADSPSELVELYNQGKSSGFDLLVQEYIPGPPTSHFYLEGFIDRNRELTGLFARKRVRISPPKFGNSSYTVSVDPTRYTTSITQLTALLFRLSYRGIFSAEFKEDERDGRAKLLEINTRPWWYVEIPTLCGMNLVRMYYEDALEQQVTKVDRYEMNRSFVYPYYDICAFRESGPHNIKETLSWFSSFARADWITFEWSDPLPALLSGGRYTSRWFRERIKRRDA